MSHHAYFTHHNTRFRQPAFRAKMTAEFPLLPFVNTSYSMKRIKFFAQLIPDYCYFRRTLSLSQAEIQRIFHLSSRSVKTILRGQKATKTFRPRRFSNSGERVVFTKNLAALKDKIRANFRDFKGEILTLKEVENQFVEFFEFIDRKPINCAIIEAEMADIIALRFQGGAVVGVKIK
ncbi:hypothetical protein SS50377_23855 [Spironucleus salmonicida]|uniref:Uncharacterized protein n=1 Tax=Spironucleus salmonicida TaxID=348837 RepID=V6LHX6_9EUKA|nr:hypothetical protein SS50377_23855 [Spironucleus salmonicida]|eukprot:EST44155.1 Hypothetical protein SS50377_16059 [Spironucleus salmonicida]